MDFSFTLRISAWWYPHEFSCSGQSAKVQHCLTESWGDLPHLGVAHVRAHALAAAKHVPDLDLAIQASRQQEVPTVWIESAQDAAILTLYTP